MHYRYQPEVFSRPAELHADSLLIAGGLYGNLAALHALHRLMEPDTQLVFNGDFNWFNIGPDTFSAINRSVLKHTATRGNVETELFIGPTDTGCGCVYAETVNDAEVERSNLIMDHLHDTAIEHPDLRASLGKLPMYLVANVGDVRVAITHGDAHSLAGWSFAHDQLHDSSRQESLKQTFERAGVDIFACSHTCLPALRTMAVGTRVHAVINNGAAGMPNFSGTRFGLATRISTKPCPPTLSLYGTFIKGIYVDAIKVHYDHRSFTEQFYSDWGVDSPAHVSYACRIEHGPEFILGQALGTPSHQRIKRRAS